ncbi:MAG: hypothetical protein J6M17_03645 [Ruminococcus sp.]|nr:hypothetical protein [Ruminococcus sp.]
MKDRLLLTARMLILSVAAFFGTYLWAGIAFSISWKRFLDSPTLGDKLLTILAAVGIIALLLIFAAHINMLFFKDTRKLPFKDKLIIALPASIISDITGIIILIGLLAGLSETTVILYLIAAAANVYILRSMSKGKSSDLTITEEEKRTARSKRNC